MSMILVILCCLAVAVVLYFLFSGVTTAKKDEEKETLATHFTPGVDHDTLYYRITDDKAVVSMIHDSGIKPSKLKGSIEDRIGIPVAKVEYNEGVEKTLSKPVEIWIGTQIFNLKQVFFVEKYEDKQDHYIVWVDNIWSM
jgi:hypothetical protein